MSYKLVVLGSCGVGKSALTIRFLHHHFVEEYEPTIRDSYQGQVVVDGEPCQVTIVDTAGRELFRDIREDCIRWGQGFLLVYKADTFRTFVDMNLFRDQLRKVKGIDPVPVVLVANMIDDADWVVDSVLGQEVGKSFGLPYVETSAKTGQGVQEAFHELVREIRRFQAMQDLKESQAEQDQGCGFKFCTIQ